MKLCCCGHVFSVRRGSLYGTISFHTHESMRPSVRMHTDNWISFLPRSGLGELESYRDLICAVDCIFFKSMHACCECMITDTICAHDCRVNGMCTIIWTCDSTKSTHLYLPLLLCSLLLHQMVAIVRNRADCV